MPVVFSRRRLADLSRHGERTGMLISRSLIWTGGTSSIAMATRTTSPRAKRSIAEGTKE